MPSKATITGIRRVRRPIQGPETKFGGAPTWVSDPTWPVSKGWPERPMMFVCQIKLSEVFPRGGSRVAYVFLTHPTSPEDTFFDPDVTEPNGGENAVVVQPGGQVLKRFLPLREGPTLFDSDGKPFEGRPRLARGDDPEFVRSRDFRKLSEKARDAYFASVDGNKLGGVPNFFQGDAWPPGRREWQLLLQLHANSMPFQLVLGASPTLFAFVSEDLTAGRVVIQDS